MMGKDRRNEGGMDEEREEKRGLEEEKKLLAA